MCRNRLECRLLANNGLRGHVACTSALPLTADIRARMSAFPLIWSGMPPESDIRDRKSSCAIGLALCRRDKSPAQFLGIRCGLL